MGGYFVPLGPGEAELTEKRSRFLGHVWPAADEAEARARIEEMKKFYHDARHNCWCYRLHTGAERYSDDGEPQGTAGVPMLTLFQKAEVTDLVCVVTRYFGGVLLGTGGLVRAYTQAAKDALAAAGVGEMRPWTRLTLACPYPLLEQVKLLCAQRGGVLEDCGYADTVSLTMRFPADDARDFALAVRELTAGALAPEALGEVMAPAPAEG